VNSIGANRKTLVFLIIVPLAIYLGWQLAEPQSFNTLMVVTMLMGVLLTPILLRWHRPILIFSWNAAFVFALLPGSPPLWMLMSGASLLIVVLESIIQKRIRLLNVPSLTWTLAILSVVVFLTAYIRGGIGLRTMGSEAYGGKRYIVIFATILGYFALSTAQMPAASEGRYTKFFFLSGLTHAVSNLIIFAGPVFFWLFLFFPVASAIQQAQAEFMGAELVRLGGVAAAMIGVFHYLLARYPLRDILSLRRPVLPLLLAATVALGSLGGFRSIVIQFGLLFVIKFLLDRLLFTRLSFAMLLVILLIGAVAVPNADRLPLSVQRAISFLPVEIDPEVRLDAWVSTEWRLQMWNLLLPELPNYLLIGKGYAINPTDLYMVQHAIASGFAGGYEGALTAGDYHSGPLSALVNFGIPGTLALLAFWFVSIRALVRNFRYGDQSVRNLNSLLLATYLSKVIFFVVIFGDFAYDLAGFCGLIGFSVAVNGGVRAKTPSSAPAGAPTENRAAPGAAGFALPQPIASRSQG